MTPKPADFGYAVQKFHVARGQRKVENVKFSSILDGVTDFGRGITPFPCTSG